MSEQVVFYSQRAREQHELVQKVAELAKCGRTVLEIIRDTGASEHRVRKALDAGGFSIVAATQGGTACRTPEQEKKVEEMLKLRRKGWKLQQIADRFGVTRQRVQQLTRLYA